MTVSAGLTAQTMILNALEQMSEAAVAFEASGNIVLFNDAAERLWGCDRRSVLGEAVATRLPEIAALAATGRATPGIAEEATVDRFDGSRLFASVTLSRLTVGTMALTRAQVRDVTDEARGRAELQLMSMGTRETARPVLISDGRRQIVYVNDAFIRTFGYERAELIGREWLDVFVGPGPADGPSKMSRRDKPSEPYQEVLRVRNKSGQEMWVSAAVSPVVDADGQVRHVVSVIEDITQTKQVEMMQRDVLEALAADLPLANVMNRICEQVERIAPEVVCSILVVDGEQRLRLLAAPSLPRDTKAAIDGLAIGPTSGACGTAAFRRAPVVVLNIATDPLCSASRDFLLPHGLKACWSSPIQLRDGRVAGTFAFYFREERGPSVWHKTIVKLCLHLCVLALERAASKAQIARLAYFDTLTGLPNRSRLRDCLREAIAQAGERPISVMIVDLDRFKDVNDTLGPQMGDLLLVETAKRLGGLLGAEDLLSRYGGDVFVAVLPGADAGRVGALAATLIETLLAPVAIENILLPVSVSVGLCVYPSDGRDEDALLRHADTAMHEAKAAGGGNFRFFSPAMQSMAQERLVLGAALREAIAHGQLRLAYQPQVDCRSGAVRGAEALARWTHPMLGEVSPARFIGLAEELGLIEQIGQWALDESCRQLAEWHRQGLRLPAMSVNLSAVHFRNPALTELVARTLARHQIKPETLTIEITEGVIMDDNPVAIDTAKAVHALGVRLSLDDFGTGYSSLSYLARLPIDELKIDRSFMRGLGSDKNAQALATAVVRIGQSLFLSVVAEGVETWAQQQFLKALDCDLLQGFLFSRALAPEDFASWYAEHAEGKGPRKLSGLA